MLQAMVDQGREGKEAIKAAPSGRLWSVGSSQGLSPQARGASPHTPTPVGYWENPPPPRPRGQKLLPGKGIDGCVHFLYFMVCLTRNTKEAASVFRAVPEGHSCLTLAANHTEPGHGAQSVAGVQGAWVDHQQDRGSRKGRPGPVPGASRPWPLKPHNHHRNEGTEELNHLPKTLSLRVPGGFPTGHSTLACRQPLATQPVSGLCRARPFGERKQTDPLICT